MASIKTFVDTVNSYGIPEFQRDFVWREAKIEKFWDSIFKKYPLPTFFMWKVGAVTDFPVGLSHFASKFKNCKPVMEEIVNFVEAEYQNIHTTAVCDGQQRLTSILIGLKGYNLGSAKANKFLYFNPFANLLNGAVQNDSDINYFEILSTAEVQRQNLIDEVNTPSKYWIKVCDFYNFMIENSRRIDIQNVLLEYINNKIPNPGLNINEISANLKKLYINIIDSNYLNFVELNDSIGLSLIQADEFFIRINNGSPMTPDSKLFALLTRYIPNDVNFQMKSDFLAIKAKYKDCFSNELKIKFLLRTCLYVITDDVLFKVDSFNRNNCTLIINNWQLIKDVIIRTFELIIELGLTKCINSNNSIIPIIYHIYSKRLHSENYFPNDEEKREILKYFLRSEISGYFGSEHGDSKLKKLKDNQNLITYTAFYNFNIEDIIHTLPLNTSFDIDDDKINKLLEFEYGKPICRPLLHLIYRNLNTTIIYELDHIHPKSICSDQNKVREITNDNEVIQTILNTHNKIANLQLIPKSCNRKKQDKFITFFVNGCISEGDRLCLNNQSSANDYYKTNFIDVLEDTDTETYLELSNYKLFYERRKNTLKTEILLLLNN